MYDLTVSAEESKLNGFRELELLRESIHAAFEVVHEQFCPTSKVWEFGRMRIREHSVEPSFDGCRARLTLKLDTSMLESAREINLKDIHKDVECCQALYESELKKLYPFFTDYNVCYHPPCAGFAVVQIKMEINDLSSNPEKLIFISTVMDKHTFLVSR